ncbi:MULTISPECIES: hypothetical protein [Bacillus cereus group]|uniref:hypothetical protein n=1 Tax=Bacillus cereus group TaxID=86661 RepID=UPI0011A694B8|nr:MULTISPECIES: hypothetical protein [Bacillus cereus group]
MAILKNKKFNKKIIIAAVTALMLSIFTGTYFYDKNTKEKELVSEAQEFFRNTRIKVLEDSIYFMVLRMN